MSEKLLFNKKFVLKNRIILDYEDNEIMVKYFEKEEDKKILLNKIKYILNKNIISKKVTFEEFVAIVKKLYGEDVQTSLIKSKNDINNKKVIENISEINENSPIVNLFNDIISKSISLNATDIHFESFENAVLVRYRVGLFLIKEREISKSSFENISVRIKFLSKLNINEKRIPQDGKMVLRLNDKKIELRVSIVPTKTGESIVLRVLKVQDRLFSPEDLGFKPKDIKILKKLINRKSGMILCTGPTGSGKTTTLHSLIRLLNTGDKKIITIEDPVEYQLDGINQIQVNEEIGLTFSSVLKRILRHDPDIIMVGEIRDSETAKLAFSASLTGHLVLSTLHTENSLMVFKRLKDLGVDDFLITSTLKMIITQRLIRKLCDNCKIKVDIDKEIIESYNLEFNHTYMGKGCPQCNYTGYKGLTIIYEILIIDDFIKNNVFNNNYFNNDSFKKDYEKNIYEHLYQNGYLNIFDYGIEKVKKGEINFFDLLRTVDKL